MTFKCPTFGDLAINVTLQMKSPGKVYPMMISDPLQSEVCSFIFTPVANCKPLIYSIICEQSVGTFEEVLDEEIPNLSPSMQVMSLTGSRWYQIEDSCTSSPSLFQNDLLIPSFPYHNQIYIIIPQEDSVMSFTELVEDPDLYMYHVETLKTLRACCAHDNTEAAKKVMNND